MLDEARNRRLPDGDYVEFARTGTHTTGEYRCSGCGYGVTVHSSLPRCPMCSGTTWEPAAGGPVTRAEPLQ